MATAATLALAALLKWPCLHHPWDGSQYASLCYTDIQALYGTRGIADGVVPYLEGFSEYPVLTGFWTWIAGSLSNDANGYLAWNILLLSAAAAWTTHLLQRAGAGRRIWLWAVAPPLFFSAFLNFDLLAVALTTYALLLFRWGLVPQTAIALGLGAATKLYPGFLVPVFAAAVWRREGPRRSLVFLGAAAAAWSLVQLPVLVLAPEGWWATYTFHAGRGQEWETLWMILAHVGGEQGWAWTDRFVSPQVMGALSRVALVAAIGLASFAAWRGRLRPESGALAVLLVFFLTSPVFNMQYVLWILPFIILLRVPMGWVGLLFFGDVAVHLTKFHLFLHLGTPEYGGHFAVFAVAVALRAAAFIGILWWLIDQAGRTRTKIDDGPAAHHAAEPSGPTEQTPAHETAT